MNKPRSLVLVAVAAWVLLSLISPPILLHAFVPERYFLRSQMQLDRSSSSGSYITKAALPYMVGTCIVFIVLCVAGWITSNITLANALLWTSPALIGITGIRFLFGGFFSGGM